MSDMQWAQAKVAETLNRCRLMAAAEWQRLAAEVNPRRVQP